MRVLKSKFVRVFLVFVLILSFCFSSAFAASSSSSWVISDTPSIDLTSNSISTFASTPDSTYKMDTSLFARYSNDLSYVTDSTFASFSYALPLSLNVPYVYPTNECRDYSWYEYLLCQAFSIYRSDGTLIGKKNQTLTVQVQRVANFFQQGATSSSATTSSPLYSNPSEYRQLILRLEGANGKSYSKYYYASDIADFIVNSSTQTGTVDISFDLVLPADCTKVYFEFNFSPQTAFGVNPNGNNYIYWHNRLNMNLSYVQFYVDYNDSGLLTDIKNGISNLTDTITDIFNISGNESTTPLPNQDINDFEASQGSLRDDSDVSSSLDDVFNDADFGSFSNGFTAVWYLVDGVLDSHPIFFSLVILVLTLGLLNLIFNRR